jgi:hypothetical protein
MYLDLLLIAEHPHARGDLSNVATADHANASLTVI